MISWGKYIFLSLAVVIGFVAYERFTLPETTLQMYRDAAFYGEVNKKETPPNSFVYDGCTLFPDSLLILSLHEACLQHDIAYWYGGEKTERKKADWKLGQATKEINFFGKILYYPMYIGVRLFGDTFITKLFNANWGYGWNK